MDSVIAVQLFDQKRFEKKDQGFLGVVNFRVGDIIDLGSIGIKISPCAHFMSSNLANTSGRARKIYP
jgi:hypothetical protein